MRTAHSLGMTALRRNDRARALLVSDPLLHRAHALARHAHALQSRWSPTGRQPYLEHPLRVFVTLASWGVTDRVVLAAALLHDTVEDAPDRVMAYLHSFAPDASTPLDMIRAAFGADVAATVDGLTNRDDVGYIEHVSAATMDARVLAVKLSDFADNAMSLEPSHPRYPKLSAKYAPLYPVLAQRLRASAEAHTLLPQWQGVLALLDARH